MAQNSIGEFNFFQLDTFGNVGGPEIPQQRNEIIQRPGVDGTIIRHLGKKGDVFAMRSTVDVATAVIAVQLFNRYLELTNTEAQTLIWRGFDYGAEGVTYQVLNVSSMSVQPIRNQIGGINGPQASGVFLRAVWQLMPIIA